MKRHIGLGWLAAGAVLFAASGAAAQTEIQWWHAMTGANNDVIVKLANDFNATQKDYKVVPTYKGSYPDTMNAGIAAFRAGNAPHIMQVFEVGTATMMAATGAVKPVHVLMKEAGEPFDPKAYLPTITGYYSTTKGEMLSVPVQLVDHGDVVQQGRLQEGGPRSRQAAEDLAGGVRGGQEAQGRRLRQLRLHQRLGDLGQHRAALGLAQRAARHQGQRPGRLRHGAEVQQPAAREASAEPGRAAEGQDLRLFRPHQHRRGPLHLGRMPDLPDLVGLLRQRARPTPSSTSANAPMPYYPGRAGRAAELDHRRRLAVGDGRQEAAQEYKGVAKFFTFLSDTDRQVELHKKSGYLPITKAAYEKTKASGYYKEFPYLETPLLELTNKEPTENSRGLRLGNMVQLRDVWAEEIEAALAGKKTAKQALDDAVARGNPMLRQFERTVTR